METAKNRQALDKEAETVTDLLDRHLATTIDLQLRIKHLLWSAENRQITEIWWLCNAASEFEMLSDLIAEWLRLLGTFARITPQDIRARSILDPAPPAAADDQERLSAILRGLHQLHGFARQASENATAIRDEATANPFARLATRINAQIWFLGAPPGRREISQGNNRSKALA
jgi:DNA-binding ferritin-like protein